jgi:hypothetical protein
MMGDDSPVDTTVALMLTAAVELVTRFPFASWICTWTAGLNGCPAVPLPVGCVAKTSLLPDPGEIVNELLFKLVRPAEAAVNV